MILAPRLLQARLTRMRPRSSTATIALLAHAKRRGCITRPMSHVNADSATAVSYSSPLLLAAALLCASANADPSLAQCSAPLGNDPVMIVAPEQEPATGIMFPRMVNGMSLAGCGVRVKWGFVKVYAVGTYFDPLAISMAKSRGEAELKKILLDPNYPRVIRIVMNRNLSIEKYTAAIIESLEPRMHGNDLGSLEEFKKLNPPVDLVEGAEIEMTVRGDTLLYKNAVGGLGQIKSAIFTKALCDVFYGAEAVSPTHLKSVVAGAQKI